MPTSLRGTMSRKHIVTVCISLDISEHDVNDLADFMGHHEKIHKTHYRQSNIKKDLAISRFLKYAQGEDTTDESDKVDEDKNENDATSASDTDLTLNTSDTSLSLKKTRQSKHLPSKRKDIKNHINTNVERKEVNRLASKRKISYESENVIESDESGDKYNTELDLNISNILSSKRIKQSEKVSNGKNSVNNTTKKKKTSPFGLSKKSAHMNRWTHDKRTTVLSSFRTAMKNKT